MKQHPVHKEIYVTEDGRVFRELTPSLDDAGYHQIRNGKFRERRHVLVCETYVGLRPVPGMLVRHKDDDNSNDHPDNLCWGTQLDNVHDAMANGLHPKGQKSGASKLTDAQALEIKKRRAAGESGKALALEFGLTEASVCDLHKGRTWSWLK